MLPNKTWAQRPAKCSRSPMHFSSDETDEFNAGLTTIGELTKTVSDRTPSDIVAREEELFEASSYVSEDVVEKSTRNTIERRNKTAMNAVLKARLARAKSPEAQRAKGPSMPSSMRGDPPAKKRVGKQERRRAGGESRGEPSPFCRRRDLSPRLHATTKSTTGRVE